MYPTAQNDNERYLHACKKGDVDLARKLLQQGSIQLPAGLDLCHAVCGGHDGLVALLLEEFDRNPEALDSFALCLAAKHGYQLVVDVLLRNGADPRACENKALRWAFLNGHIDVAESLICAGAEVSALDVNLLAAVTERGDLRIVRMLVERFGVNPCGQKHVPVRYALLNHQLDILQYYLRKSKPALSLWKGWALKTCIERNMSAELGLVLKELEFGPSLNKVLASAVHKKNIELTKRLVQGGANPKSLSSKDLQQLDEKNEKDRPLLTYLRNLRK